MSRRIITLAGLGLAITSYFIFFRDRNDLLYLFALCLLIGVIGYTFQYQIDQLMIRGVPQRLDPAMSTMLTQTSPWFTKLHLPQQRLVEDRMKRWVMKKDVIEKNEQDAPEDLKYIVAFYGVMLTLHQASFLFEGLDRIAFYHHPFLSPAHPEDVHIGEVEGEDGTLIFSVPHVIKGHLEKGYYNLALHVMAEAYKKLYLKKEIVWDESIWDRLENISGMSRDRIEAYLGLPLTDPWPVAVHHQYTYQGADIEEVVAELPQLRRYTS